jgi:diacylglycerol O-acyltransferase / wax synthase
VTQKHMDRLSAVDATFLHQESATTHMHIGALVILEGTPPSFDEFLAHIASKLHQVPRYRQKLAMPPYQTGRPLWIDDPTFHLEYHVRHSALPRPGTDEQLEKLSARIFSQQLDRTKPLWEMWLIEGLRGDRFAIINKSHHALVDGVSGAELATVLFDLSPEYVPTPARDWIPRPEPSRAELLAAGARDAVSLTTSTAASMVGALSNPSRLVGSARETIEGLGEVAWAGINPAPASPLNVPLGPHRRYRFVRGRLDDYKLIKNAFGGTVNDAVLTVVAGALARFLRGRGVRTEGLQLRAAVPVSVRGSDKRNALGNEITLMLAPLPVHIDEPVARLAEVRAAMDGIKKSKQALGAATIAGLQRFAPPTLLAVSSRLSMSPRMYNVLVTNVPGPQFPVYALGRRLLEIAPIPFLAPDHAVAIAIMSYDGGIDFGVLADYDAIGDLDVLTGGIDDALTELVGLARSAVAEAASSGPAPAPSAAQARAAKKVSAKGAPATKKVTAARAAPAKKTRSPAREHARVTSAPHTNGATPAAAGGDQSPAATPETRPAEQP